MTKQSVGNTGKGGTTSGSTSKPKTKSKPSKDLDKEILSIKEENENLRLQLAEILSALKSTNVATQDSQEVKPVENNEYVEDVYIEEISPNKQVRVMSLLNHTLVLSTEPYGKGKIYTFNKYGETKPMLYSTLVDIVENQRSFAENGDFYIMNEQAVYNIGLTEEYKTILSKDKIDSLLALDDSSMSVLFTNTNHSQRESIVDILVEKIVNNVYVDLNKVDKLSKIYGENIKDIADNIITMQKTIEKDSNK